MRATVGYCSKRVSTRGLANAHKLCWRRHNTTADRLKAQRKMFEQKLDNKKAKITAGDDLAPGVLTVAQVLRALLSAVPVDHVNTMGIPPDDPYAQQGEPPVWNEFRAVIAESGSALKLEPILKWDFYKHVESPDHVLTIQTADQALWGNVLLTMGCRIA